MPKATTTTEVPAHTSISSATISRTTTTASTTTTAVPIAQAAVSFSIDGSAAAPYGYNVSLPAQAITLNDGESVFDLLNRCGVSVQSNGSGRMAYVSGIGGLREKDCGGNSGWVYEVNGARPPVGCGAYQPKGGDEIVWRYSLAP